MTVYFIGAGPGAADLLTVRASRLIARCGTCLYSGVQVPPDVLATCPPTARIVDTDGIPPGDLIAEIRSAHERGDHVALLHPGDPSVYSAVDEHTRALDAEGVPWEIVPGVPAFAAAAAGLGVELTVPHVSQSVILTRVDGRTSAMPPGEDLASVCASGATAVIHLAVAQMPRVVRELTPVYGASCPVAVTTFADRPDDATVRGTLADITDRVTEAGISETAVIVIGRVLDRVGGDQSLRSSLSVEARPAPVTAAQSGPPGRILVLGGTGEGRQLADLMVTAGLDVVTSLADRVPRPRSPRGEIRIGGFGGSDGLARWLVDHGVSAVIDATHPFAEHISATAARATAETDVPLLRLYRRAWSPRPDDEWIRVSDMAGAARVVREDFRRPMLTVGREGLDAFAGDTRGSYLIRCVEPPTGPLPHRYLLVLDRGPFGTESERTLMARHRIDVLVAKNSGGEATEAKLEAARLLRIPVVMVDRPTVPAAETAHTVDEAARWLVERFGSR